MTDFTSIETALHALLDSFADAQGVDVAWPNDNYAAEPDAVFLQPTNILVPAIEIGLGDDDSDLRDGIYQVDVFVPNDSGTRTALELAKGLAAHFARGLTPVDDAEVRLRMKSTDIETGSAWGTHYQLPVLINYSTVTR
jgi:hypothetical protein